MPCASLDSPMNAHGALDTADYRYHVLCGIVVSWTSGPFERLVAGRCPWAFYRPTPTKGQLVTGYPNSLVYLINLQSLQGARQRVTSEPFMPSSRTWSCHLSDSIVPHLPLCKALSTLGYFVQRQDNAHCIPGILLCWLHKFPLHSRNVGPSREILSDLLCGVWGTEVVGGSIDSRHFHTPATFSALSSWGPRTIVFTKSKEAQEILATPS